MRGQVVDIAYDESEVFIRGEDSNRYPISVTDLGPFEPVLVAASVDFEMAGRTLFHQQTSAGICLYSFASGFDRSPEAAEERSEVWKRFLSAINITSTATPQV